MVDGRLRATVPTGDDGARTIAEIGVGETLIRFGQDSLSCYLVLTGSFEIANGSTIEAAEVLNEAEPGDFVGEVALLAGGEQMVEARATADARLAVL